MEKRSILICPWGKFDNWEEVTYYYRDLETEKTRSTLKIMHEITKPDRTVIFVQDTLVTALRESYQELCEVVMNETYKFITDHKLIPQEMDLKNLLVKILPGVGNYSTWSRDNGEYFLGEFKGSMEPMSIIVFQQLFDAFYSLFQEKNKEKNKLEINLDLTHGMNILPVMVYKIVGELSQLFAMVGEVSLKVYISEPFIRGNENIKLQIHEIENLKVEGFIPRFEFTKEIGNLNSKKLNAFVSSIHFGFPLLALYTFPKQKDLALIIKKEILSFNSGIEITSKKGKLKIKKNPPYKKVIAKHTREIHQELYKLLIVYAYASLHSIDLPDVKNGVIIKKLRDLSKEIYSKEIYSNNTILNLIKNNTILNLINSELSNLRYNIAENAFNKEKKLTLKVGWTPYTHIIKKNSSDNIETRNFSAHIGLERNTIEIFIESLENHPDNPKKLKEWLEKSAKIRYRDAMIDKIYETAESILDG